jgi:hypothetical protein
MMPIKAMQFRRPVTLSDQVLAMFAGGLGAGGYQGLMLDLSKASSLYTDSARTTLVSTAGDLIGSPSDLSPNGNHPLQATAANRPAWQTTYAAFDGVNDAWATGSIDFTGTDAVTVVTAFRKNNDATTQCVYELSSSQVNNGMFDLFAPISAGSANMRTNVRGTVQALFDTTLAAPATLIHTMQQDISAPLARARVNGGAWSQTTASQGTGNLGNYPFYIGARVAGAFRLNGNYYRQLVIGKFLSDAELAIAEAWANETVLVLP